jgi:Na+/H+ antiporter NhaB
LLEAANDDLRIAEAFRENGFFVAVVVCVFGVVVVVVCACDPFNPSIKAVVIVEDDMTVAASPDVDKVVAEEEISSGLN